jgi:hypothetical protein
MTTANLARGGTARLRDTEGTREEEHRSRAYLRISRAAALNCGIGELGHQGDATEGRAITRDADSLLHRRPQWAPGHYSLYGASRLKSRFLEGGYQHDLKRFRLREHLASPHTFQVASPHIDYCVRQTSSWNPHRGSRELRGTTLICNFCTDSTKELRHNFFQFDFSNTTASLLRLP